MSAVGKYLVVRKHDFENFCATVTFTHKEPAIKEARKLAGSRNNDYLIVKVIGIMQALVETKLIEESEE